MGQFTSDNQPSKRGKSFKNKLLETIREGSLLGVPEGASNEATEKAYIEHVATRAFDSEDMSSSALLKELINKSYPTLKAALPEYQFDLSENSTPAQKAEAVFKAIANGQLPPDIGNMLIQAAKGMVDIEVGTELKVRIEKLEAALNG